MMRNTISPEEAHALIKKSGLKKTKFAELAGIRVQTLSEYLNGWRILSVENSNKVNNTLKKLEPLLMQ